MSKLQLLFLNNQIHQLLLLFQSITNLIRGITFHYFFFNYRLIGFIIDFSTIKTWIIIVHLGYFIIDTLYSHIVDYLFLCFYIRDLSSNMDVKIYVFLKDFISKTRIAMTRIQASRTPSFFVKDLSIKLIFYAV